MTGFGKAVCELSGKKITVEIKSLNSKQFDLNVKLPQKYKDKEILIRNELSKLLERGKIDLTLNEDLKGAENPPVINKFAVESYYRSLKETHERLGLPVTDRIMQIIMRLPGSLITEEEEPDEAEWEMIYKELLRAAGQLLDYRLKEGQSLEKDINNRIVNIINISSEIDKFEKQRLYNIRARINSNIIEYLGDQAVDKNRLEQELVYYIEKLDITEEKVRLASHCKYFTETVASEPSAGKKLGFIVQEIGREINTIGSKAYDADIQRIVVRMKDELEKVKEQLLNIL
jgi:uncharacterized protein (TIGR00255 family)